MADKQITLAMRLSKQAVDGALSPERQTVVPSIPTPTLDPASLKKSIDAIRQILLVREGGAGSALDKNLTLRDLAEVGIADINIGTRTYSGSSDVVSVPGADGRPTYDTPPTIIGLAAQGAFKNVILTWDISSINYANFAYVEVWRNTSDNLGSAALIGTSTSANYSDGGVAVGATYYYWVRARNTANAPGAYNAVAGTVGALLRIGNTDLGDLVVTADKLSQGTYAGINMVPNGSAEDGLTSWIIGENTSGSNTFIIDASQKTGGSQSFRLTKATSGDGIAALSRAMPVIPGETYSIKLKVLGNGAAAGGLYVRAMEKTAAPSSGYVSAADSFTDMVGNGPIPAAWTSLEYTYTVPANKYWVSLAIYIWAGSGGSATVLNFDDVSFGRQITASHLAAGSIAVGSAAIANGAISNAMIANAAIDDAKISDLSASKITAGSMNASFIEAGSITADRMQAGIMAADNVLTRGLTVRDANGNVILSSGYQRIRGTNLMDPSWWKVGATSLWASNDANGSVTDFVDAARPDGTNGIVMRATAGSAVGAEASGGGGWNANSHATNGFPVDTTKEYIFAVYIKTVSTGAVHGSAYWGIQGDAVCNLNTTTPNSNPYFAVGTLAAGKWYLFFGRVYPYGSTGKTNGGSGIYDCETGQLISGGSAWAWNNISFCPGTRSYLYYSRGGVQYFSNPQAWVCDGTEPTLADLLAMGTPSARNQITSSNASTYIANAAIQDAQIGNLSAAKITTGTMDAARITAGTITTDRLVTGAVTAASQFSSSSLLNGISSGNAGFTQDITLTSSFAYNGGTILLEFQHRFGMLINATSTANNIDVVLQIRVNGTLLREWESRVQPAQISSTNKQVLWDASEAVMCIDGDLSLFSVGSSNTIVCRVTGTAYNNNTTVAVGASSSWGLTAKLSSVENKV